MTTAAAYLRVSTSEQAELSPDSQLKKIREYAERNDILLLEDHIYMDEGISGKRTQNRQAFNAMIGAAKQKPKPFDTILLWKFSRFARNREDSIVYKSMLRKQCDIQVVSVSEDIGDDKTSILIEAIIEAMDEYYSINLAEEVRRGMTEKVSRGGAVCKPPIGYEINDGKIFPGADAPMVRSIFEDFVNGMGYRTIAQKYAEMGLKTTRGNKPDNRCIEYMIRNPIYTGKIRWCTDGRGAGRRDYFNQNNMVVAGVHEAIISQELFDKAQERADTMKRMYGKSQRPEQPISFMLKGLMRCSACGATLTHLSTACPSLQCHNYSRGSCTVSHCISLRKADAAVIAMLEELLSSDSIQVNRIHRTNTVRTDDYEKVLHNLNVRLERAKNAYLDGIDTMEEYKANKARIQNDIDLATAAMAQIPKDPPVNTEVIRKRLTAALAVVKDPSATPDAKNKALRTVIKHITYDKRTRSLDIVLHD